MLPRPLALSTLPGLNNDGVSLECKETIHATRMATYSLALMDRGWGHALRDLGFEKGEWPLSWRSPRKLQSR